MGIFVKLITPCTEIAQAGWSSWGKWGGRCERDSASVLQVQPALPFKKSLERGWENEENDTSEQNENSNMRWEWEEKNVRVSPGSTGGRAGATCCSCCQGAPNGGDKYNCLLQLSGIIVFPFPVLQWSSLHHLHASVKSPESKHCKSLGQYHGIEMSIQEGCCGTRCRCPTSSLRSSWWSVRSYWRYPELVDGGHSYPPSAPPGSF